LVTTLYNEIKDSLNHDGKLINLSHQGAVPPSFLTAFPLRMHQYKPILSQLRVNLIDRMPKPEEVLVVENEDGEVVRETTQETDALEIYNSTKGCLVILTHLDFEDTHQIMKDKLARQIDGSNWSWTNLNRLCWAIGSISGTTSESSEKQFIVGIIKDLLGLCDFKKGKDNKAIVASNIMYVVGQYPRFLKKHWKFLKTVVNKLFEFMHESHEGVQDMACDTLKHITTKCGRHFVNLQPDEDTPYIYEIIKHLPKITSDLGPTQICVVYECLGQMIYSDNGPVENEILVERLMQEPNSFWSSLVTQFTSDPNCLRASDRVKLFNYFLRVNLAVSTYSKHLFNGQMAYLYPNLLKLYTNCSSIITQAVQENPNYGHVTPVVRGVRSIKKDILKLITSYVSTCRNQDEVAATMVPSLFDTVLYDYNNMVNGAKEVEVLKLLCTLTSRLNKRISPHMNTVFNNVFVCTMGMICTDFTDHLDIRLEFYTMIRNIVKHCFDYILTLNPDAFSQVYKSIVWASKHITHDISEIGLLTFSELIEQFQVCPENVRNDFFTMCLYTMLQDVVNLITDRDHKSGFATQCRIMAQILKVVNSNVITIPLFNPQNVNDPNMTNEIYFREMVTSTFDVNFPHIGRNNTTAFVQDLMVSIDDLPTFKLKMMDFLIQIKVITNYKFFI
jgi:exportin-1